jgi:XTP/dITP diphosphohydrolase
MHLLLHMCCAPCSIYPVEVLLGQGIKITGFFYNPNIHPYQEHKRRLQTLVEYTQAIGITLVQDPSYDLKNFLRKIVFHEEERCLRCYSLRLEKTAVEAHKQGCSGFSTTLLYSRYQKHDDIKSCGEQFAEKTGMPFFYRDFRQGWQYGVNAAVAQNMYRQPYCGCIYSEQERYQKKKKNSVMRSYMLPIIVLATRNKNKIKEFKELLTGIALEIRSLGDFGPIPEAVEDGLTFDDNAYKKAYHTAKVLGLPALADDSGLAVTALNGAPGVHSARYAGDRATDEDNCRKLLREMEEIKDRRASFHCVISLAVPSGPALTYEGSCDGIILSEPRGTNGFGYDPLFYFPQLGKTFAELTIAEKGTVSHRGKVLQEFRLEIDKIKKWLEQRLAEEKPPKPDHRVFSNNDWSV